jgi:hypothetical protein
MSPLVIVEHPLWLLDIVAAPITFFGAAAIP